MRLSPPFQSFDIGWAALVVAGAIALFYGIVCFVDWLVENADTDFEDPF